ncbi:hypothetical protein [Nostoc cycadae]|uniref:Uncharacterized protein n=1 Tax=Nostoc cycadae WK-1 TaxID=1861711 RepID=A0A2H6LQZ6_9NOSO|nr:hypothetical protein [Nostoc cycadae]GBE95630.1 hypothetical protein NCWK1_5418 [Nostoc cycadae WK-1]
MSEIERLERESNEIWASRLGAIAAHQLKGVKDEQAIREITLKYWEPIRAAITSDNSLKRPRTAFAKAITEKFPNSQKRKPGYYHTKPRGKAAHWEHLALWYATSNRDRWDVVGDEARVAYKVSFEQPTQPEQPTQTEQIEQTQQATQPEQTEQITLQQEATTTVLSLETMNIAQLELDVDTQKVVEDAIAYSGMSLAEFVKKACQVYAKTVTGKVKLADEDLTPVPTAELMSEKYKTHPGRADELTRRAIYALEVHNNNCTERNQKWHINQTAIQTLTGSKPATIKKILENYQIRLDDHNAKHELNPYDNRKPGIKIDEAINLVELVPDGLNVV